MFIRLGFARVHVNYHRAGEGPTLVLIHGIGHRWQGWQPVIDRLAPHRDVIAIDVPGFADSPMPPAGTPPGAESLTDLVGGFLDELGLTRPHVAGNSLGGWISLELAKRDRVASATAVSPAGFQNRPEAVYQQTSFRITVRAARLIAPRAGQILRPAVMRQIAFAQLVAHPQRLSAADIGPTIRALAGAPWFDGTLRAINRDSFRGGEQIQVPVTIAWGDRDRILLPRQSRRAARAIPTARMLTLRGCGHVPMSDDPDQVAQVLLEGSGG